MSHFIERKEKNCLNCNAVVYGRFCHLCGQENIVPRESFGHLVTHFIYDITHFDNKFFNSVKYLLFRPAFLTREYVMGKRARYLNPIKMYVFISAVFFLFFFSVINPSLNDKRAQEVNPSADRIRKEIVTELRQMQGEMRDMDNSPETQKFLESKIQLLIQDTARMQKDSLHLADLNYIKFKQDILARASFNNLRYYDSVQASLPKEKRDGWLQRTVQRKSLEIKSKYNDQNEFIEKLLEKFRHSFPQLLFVSLPLFAFLLKLLYARGKTLFYVDHVIFSVHLYCAMFLLLFLFICLSHYDNLKYLHWLRHLTTPVLIYIIWYQFKSLRNFYEQGRRKTVLKYFLLLFMSSMVLSLLFLVFLVFSVLNM